ncbi:MAG: sugar ABC transporter ATP-binding protein [Propionicimonas sp.]|nr:sugar ABC transporter ATP-binding protein [Propionicimonas sp.]
MASDQTPTLECEGLSKTYGAVKALDQVSINLQRGEVRALLGKNGAGKSTLVKLLSGTEHPDRGHDTIRLDGTPVHWAGSGDARRGGIAVVHQEFSLVPELSVAENVMVGRWPRRHGFVDHKAIRAEAARAIETLGEPLPLDLPVGRLSTARQQLVEIAKTLLDEPKVLILDEPTSALNSREVEALLATVRRLSSRGVSVIYVSHRMREIPLVADSMTILRDGREVATVGVNDLTTDEVAALIAGKSSERSARPATTATSDEVVLAVEDLRLDGILDGVSFDLHKGEVIGLAGLLGSGRTEILTTIYGGRNDCRGTVRVNGRAIEARTPSKMLRLGVAMTPEDRKDAGVVPLLSIQENLMLCARGRVLPGPLVAHQRENQIAHDLVRKLDLAASSTRQPIGSLSGGNQQKGVIGRCLAAQMSILLLDEPTRGIDVGSKAQVYDLVRDLAAQGISSIFVSSELEELTEVCDRILILRDGRIREELRGAQTTSDRLLALTMKSDNKEN